MKQNVEVLTSLKQLDNDNNYINETYIGTDARFVTMPSGNNLTVSSFLGEPSECKIGTVEGTTNTFIEESFGLPSNNRDYYKKETTIEEIGTKNMITEKLFIMLYDLSIDGEEPYNKELVSVGETVIDGEDISKKLYTPEEYINKPNS